MDESKTEERLLKDLSNCIRVLSADAVEKAKSGHPGMPMGIADVFTILAFEFLKFKPEDPLWSDRDRLVLSAGHGSMLLYSFYYLAGYKDFSLDDIKNFRQLHSKCAGHPEYGLYPAIETTTGPLGQGIANAVGMAIAAKKEGKNHKIYAIVGDGCLMEGIAYEALSLAGHLRLDNLVVIFDDNKITIDGPTSLTISEDHQEKMHSFGFNCFETDGHDFASIRSALQTAKFSGRPSFVACRTTIGHGSPNKEGKESSHGAPLGAEEIREFKMRIDWESYDEFYIPENLLNKWRDAWKRNGSGTNTPAKAPFRHELDAKILYEMNQNMAPEATRVSSGRIVSYLMNLSNNAIFGSADLSGSNNLISPNARIINNSDFEGNYIHYGPREHAMGAIMNGIAKEGIKAIGSTFLVFSDYMRPAIRLAALMKLPVVYVFTHDSIGLGEDGPTHQPVEHLAALRAIPNLLVMRPADYVETVEAWQVAWDRFDGPTALVLSRQATSQISRADEVNQALKGAYVVDEDFDPQVTIFASGSELGMAMDVSSILQKQQIKTSIVSVICQEMFERQDDSYKEEILNKSNLNVVIEAGIRQGWDKYLKDNGLFFGVETFGESAPAKDVYNHFGLNPEAIATRILEQM